MRGSARTERRAGELLRDMPKAKPPNPRRSEPATDDVPTYAEQGISLDNTSST